MSGHSRAAHALSTLLLCLIAWGLPAANYDLASTKGMKGFAGSAAAKELLARNGFVVADPAFKQIFQPYIQSPETGGPTDQNPFGEVLPSFITTDSAWHTYHVLLEEGVKEMEEIQMQRLARFSRLLLDVTRKQAEGLAAKDLGWYASVGLAFQDEAHRKSLPSDQKQIVDGLRSGSALVNLPIGFELSPLQFRAQSFYTQSPELSDYFAARQWYASVVFRLSQPQETKLALALANLINQDSELLRLWKQLSEPLDVFLAPAEDGTVRDYAEATKAVLGTNTFDIAALERRVPDIQKRIESKLPVPRVNDQQLSPAEYADFSSETRGFRLLPPRRLPCAVVFHNTTDPKIPGRHHPSGLDFLAASPVLRSPAAVRALQSQFGKPVSDAILKADCGPMPDSLHGQAMHLLAKLQTPLPKEVPRALRTEAWADQQLWTQLGAWAEQRHTWALHTKISVNYMGIITPPVGMVAPYPEFFAGLAKLTRRTAAAFEQAGLEQPFEVKAVASELLDAFALTHKQYESRYYREFEKFSSKLEQFSRFQSQYNEKHRAEIENARGIDGYKKLANDLESLAQRCAASGQANDEETKTLRAYYDSRQVIAHLLNEFAPVCDRLAVLAQKSLTAQPLTDDNAKWVRDYGTTLAYFHFYYGNSYEVPRDDFPIVTRVFVSPVTSSVLYAGLARPQALYVIAPSKGGLQLYRGAVMTYREFIRPDAQPLDDQSWRELLFQGKTPAAPPFTSSFYAEKSFSDWMKLLRGQASGDINFGDLRDTLWHINAKATEKEIPELLDFLAWSTNSADSLTPDVAEIIGRLPWEPYQKRLRELLSSPDTILADSAVQILSQQPTSLDVAALIAGLDSPSPRTRRLHCVLLSRVPQQTEATESALLRALESKDDGLRWQAAMAVGYAHWQSKPPIEALLGCLKDSNQFVAAAAVHSLFRLGATNSAPVLMKELKERLAPTNPTSAEQRQQAQAIRDRERSSRPVGGYSGGLEGVLDPDSFHLDLDIQNPQMKTARTAMLRSIAPEPQPNFKVQRLSSGLIPSLIEVLGAFEYRAAEDELMALLSTDYANSAMLALRQLAPEHLARQLLTQAQDKQLDAVKREEALIHLCVLGDTNQVRNLIPLLDDTTPIVFARMRPGMEWHICDRTADTIAALLGWQDRLRLYAPQPQREALITRARQWANAEGADRK
jgi:HEAT repeat protein